MKKKTLTKDHQMLESIAFYSALVLTAFIGQIASELTKIRKILELQHGLDKTDSDKKTVEAYE
jgi:hypothetical protein